MELSEYLKSGLKDLCKPKQSCRITQIRKLRQESRDKCTMSQRDIAQSSVKVIKPNKINARMQAMLAWKAEKKLKEEQNNKKVKPIFKVSKVVSPKKLEDIYPQKVNNSIKLVDSVYKFKPPKNVKPINMDQTFVINNKSSKNDFVHNSANDSANRKVPTKRTAVKNIKGKTNNKILDKIDDARKVSNSLKFKPKVIKMEEPSLKEIYIKHNQCIKNIKSPKNIMDVSESSKSALKANDNFVKENSMSKDAIINVQAPKKLFRKRLYGTTCYIKKC